MSAPKVGDRVQIRTAGVVTEPLNASSRYQVRLDGNGNHAWIDANCLTVLAPPVKVGDVVTTVEQLDELRDQSVIRPLPSESLSSPAVAVKNREGRWCLANGTGLKLRAGSVNLPAKVLDLGGDES